MSKPAMHRRMVSSVCGRKTESRTRSSWIPATPLDSFNQVSMSATSVRFIIRPDLLTVVDRSGTGMSTRRRVVSKYTSSFASYFSAAPFLTENTGVFPVISEMKCPIAVCE